MIVNVQYIKNETDQKREEKKKQHFSHTLVANNNNNNENCSKSMTNNIFRLFRYLYDVHLFHTFILSTVAHMKFEVEWSSKITFISIINFK